MIHYKLFVVVKSWNLHVLEQCLASKAQQVNFYVKAGDTFAWTENYFI